MNVSILPSARLKGPRDNLKAFIAKARAVAAFGAVDFDAAVWVVELKKNKRPTSAHRGPYKLYFTEANLGARGLKGRKALERPFADFLKGMVRLQEDAGSKSSGQHDTLIRAGRYLHAEMGGIGHDPCLLLADHFVKAAAASRVADSPMTANRIGLFLEEIANWANRYNIPRVQINFHNPNPRPDDINCRIGAEAEARREKKLPSAAALDAVAMLSNLVTKESDVLQIRVIELFVCGGWRMNELLTIPENCEVEEEATENGRPILGPDGKQIIRYGIRYYGEKGAPPLPKWIPTPLVDVAKRAIADIRRITQPTRDAILWMRKNPGKVPAPELADCHPDELITIKRLETALGLAPEKGYAWCRTWGVRILGTDSKRVRIRDIAKALEADWPALSPSSPLKLHEFMFLTPSNMTHATRATITGSVRFLTDGMICRFLGGHRATKSVFDRFGFVDDHGQPIRMNSHQFRHWLNTLANEGGMSDLELARWSGRKDVAQNAAYDHVSGAQLAKRVRSLLKTGDIRGPISQAHDSLPPQDRKRFREAQIATAHVTDIGMCVHDWSLTPCPKHGACASCDEHMVDKGNTAQREETERLLDETEFLLARAREEAADGTYGAPRWVEAHERMAQRLKAIMTVHNDPSIPDGTLVQPQLPPMSKDVVKSET